MKKRTLNQTWVLCLRMWRSISKIWDKDGPNIHNLKASWLRENGFALLDLKCNCFFCDWTGPDDNSCNNCPGKLVNPSFSCCRLSYDYEDKPVAFYKELLRLNRIRKAKK